MYNENDDITMIDGEEVFYPGQFDYDQAQSLEELNAMFQHYQEDSALESKRNLHRFIISTVISVFALIASTVAAIAALIPLF